MWASKAAAEGRWKIAFAKKTSSACIPTNGRKASPRPKNRGGRITTCHLRSLKLDNAVIVDPRRSGEGQNQEKLATWEPAVEQAAGRGIITAQKVISIHHGGTGKTPLPKRVQSRLSAVEA